MGRQNSSRRWAVQNKLDKDREQWTEHNITPDEARTAIEAIMPQIGNQLGPVRSYDPATDKFIVTIMDWEGKVMDYPIPGQVVGEIVLLARALNHGNVNSALIRPSEARRKIEEQLANGNG